MLMKKVWRSTTVVICLLLVVAVSGCAAENPYKTYTAEQILETYAAAVQTGDVKILNQIMSKDYFKTAGSDPDAVNNGTGYVSFTAQKLSDIKIAPYDLSQFSPETAEKYRKKTESAYYSISFQVVDGANSMFSGPVKIGFFVELIQEDNVWKINDMIT